MELKWLKDFIALYENGSFSKAAEARFVTQPAFSRRIRSLENWLGVALVNRDKMPISLTPVGEKFVGDAKRLSDDIYQIRDQLNRQKTDNSITFLAQHSPAVSFFPGWVKTINPLFGGALVKLIPGNLYDLNESFLAGNGDFLLTFSSNLDDTIQHHRNIQCIQVGTDKLLPVTSCCSSGKPDHQLKKDQTFDILTYPEEAFLGALVKHSALSKIPKQYPYRVVCENSMSEGLKAMAIHGYGVTWLPESLIIEELGSNKLIALTPDLATVDLRILLYRNRHDAKPAAERFWQDLCELYGANLTT
ncbi:LysR family transcriptional regulator [Vibrio sp. S9_S30]|uniref:LysR family transcriptional regulator n=1 Tax=Vibrio sp. S9_S30 TaxID=2720226 RepID=UPI0016810909|nr:LysR family transcriptional regulator [Vibrio sp. S9_S30]MBD1559289.1 LysR family transcriptional regulator [Vibrio sp. S9_S30]